MDFVDYCERHGVATVTTQAALAWATATTRSRDPLWWARRLMVVRIFARYLQALDPVTEVPPGDVLPHSYRRTTPYQYSPQQLTDLLQAPRAGCGRGCAAITWAADDRAARRRAACGSARRVGSTASDVDLDEGVLTVRGVEVRQDPDRAGALHHPRRPADLHRPPRPAVPAPGVGGVLRHQSRHPALDAHNTSHTFTAACCGRAGIVIPPGLPPAPAPRPAPLGGRRGYVPCRVVVPGEGRVGRVFVRIIPAVGVTAPASRASRSGRCPRSSRAGRPG